MESADETPILPLIIGTAGHIDHGKSTLVEALTGIDPDRLEEEKARGLTIDLGFARMELSDGRRVGIVDVPGHERFIRNMVAGASGIDLVVLVVAADDGVMPQTREHLAIMQILGVERGLVALTKVDLVDEELALLAQADVEETLLGTFLEGAPIVHVSAPTGLGLERLRSELEALAASVEPRSAQGVFRMPVQRVFSARGFGTIVTGIPVSGTAQVGDELEVLPLQRRAKVRGIQAYHTKAERARAGHSAALNLADIDHHAVTRGDVVATPGFFRPVRMLGARLSALPHLERPLANRTPVRVHTGTAEAVGEVVLLDVESLEPGAECLAQLRLTQPLVTAPGDRFVLRLASPALTLAGGVVLEESRYRLKRFKGFVLDELERQARSLGSTEDLLESMLARAPEQVVGVDALCVETKSEREVTRAALASLSDAGRVQDLGGGRWIHVEVLERSLEVLRAAISAWFDAHPVRRVVDVRDVRAGTSLDDGLVKLLLKQGEERGLFNLEAGGKVALAGRGVELDAETDALGRALVERLDAAGFQPPAPDELASALGQSEAQLRPLLDWAADDGRVVRVGADLWLSARCCDEARQAITENCQAHGKLEIPALRDRLGTTRKFLIPLLEHFDAQGLTLRQGGHRVLKTR